MAVHYRCKHCNRWRLDHKANTYHCPIGPLRNSQFSKEQIYEPNPKRPSKEKFTI